MLGAWEDLGKWVISSDLTEPRYRTGRVERIGDALEGFQDEGILSQN